MQGTQPVGRGTRLILVDDVGRGSMDDSFTWGEYGRPGTYAPTFIQISQIDEIILNTEQTNYVSISNHYCLQFV